MSVIKPFKGVRPVPAKAKLISSPPYDVLNSEEARQMVQNNPLSFLRVVKAEVDFESNHDTYADDVYARAKENFEALKLSGDMQTEASDCLYLYRQEMKFANGWHGQTGIVAGVSVEEYEKGLIKKHELTRVAKEKDRTRHVNTLKADAGPVFLTYRAEAPIDALVTRLSEKTPEYDFTSDDGVKHVFWVIREATDIKAITDRFSEIPCLYIADGHHRSASGAAVGKMQREANANHSGDEPYNFFLAVIFPDNQMKILDYNRVVKDLNDLDSITLLEQIAADFEVEKTDAAKPTAPHTFGMYLDDQWYSLRAKPESFDASDPVASLDVDILQKNLLAKHLGIGDPRTDERIDFVGGIRGTAELEKRVAEGWRIAFSMFPTSIEQLMAIADADKIMPPKSTWFEPKLRSGLIVKPR